jgi:hypothetical protein
MSRGNRIGTTSVSVPNLVGHWKFQEGPGLIVQDYSGGCRHGKIFGAKYVPGLAGINSALSFNGNDDRVIIPNYNTNIPIANLTFVFSFKGNRIGNGWTNGYSCGIVSHSSNDVNEKNGWWVEWRNSGSLELGTFVSGVYTPFIIRSNFKDTSSWHVLKGSISRNGIVKVFLDNNLLVDSKIENWQDSILADFVVGKGNTLDVSNNPVGYNQFFSGSVGEIMIFNSIQGQ